MDVLISLVVGIVSSIVAGILLVGLGSFFSERARWVLTATMGRILNIDIEYVFSNVRAASDDLHKELQQAHFVDLITGRGNELQREMFQPLMAGGITNKQVRILLPHFQTPASGPDWTSQRERELATIDPSFGAGMLQQQIETTIKFLEPHVKTGRLQLRLFDAPHMGRVLLTDHYAYFTPYRKDAHGRESRVIKYRRGGDMYDWLARLFEQLWEVSTPIS